MDSIVEEVDVVDDLAFQEAVKLFGIDAVGALDLPVQAGRSRLGIPRPTLVKLLTEQRIPYSAVGRHRRVMLKDLVDYQTRSRTERQAALRQLARKNQESGMLDLVYQPDEPDA